MSPDKKYRHAKPLFINWQVLLLFLISICHFLDALAQNTVDSKFKPYFHFKHFGSSEGLIPQDIRQIIQDEQDFLWLATNNGLVRYDGHDFKQYHFQPDDPNSISHNVVSEVLEDSRGWLWILTDNEVLHCLDKRQEVFYRFGSTPHSVASLPQKEVSEIAEDIYGRLWIIGEKGLICMSFQKGRHENGDLFFLKDKYGQPYTYNIQLLSNTSKEGILYSYTNNSSIYADQKGNLWTSDHSGIIKFSLPETLEGDSVSLNGFVNYKVYPYSIFEEQQIDRPIPIYEDRQQILWALSSKGRFQYIPERDCFIFHPFIHPLHSDFLIRHQGGVSVIEDAGQSFIWVADNYFGFSIIDPVSGQPISMVKDFNGNTYGVNTIFEDRSGLVWFGTFWGGLYQYDPQASRFLSYHPRLQKLHQRTARNLRFIEEDRHGNLWMATDTLYRVDRRSAKFEPIILPKEQDGSWIFKNDVLEASNGHIWIACEYDNLFEYNPYTKVFRTHTLPEGESLSIIQLLEDSQGTIWMLSSSSQLYSINPTTKVIHSYDFISHFERSDQFSEIYANTIYQDEEGLFWIGTRKGLFVYNRQKNQTKFYGVAEGLKHPGITGIMEDSEKRYLWLTTKGGGLSRLDKKTNRFSSYSTKEGLMSNQLFGIIEDDEKRLWISSDKGISSFEPQSGKFRNYDEQDGLPTNDFSWIYGGNVFKNKAGEMFFSGSKGFVIFDPQALYENASPPSVAITDFKIRYQSVSLNDEDSPLKTEISQAEEIVIPYTDNSISFTFSALHYHAPKKNQYSCMLEGYDDWLQLGTQRQVYYTGIPPGTYTLKVKAANADGVWSAETKDLSITILPPWWLTWWAYMIYYSLILATIYAIYSFLKRRWELQSQLRLEQEEAQRLKELDTFKSDFYANITHEFRTPLAVILGIAGQLHTQLEEKGKTGIHLILRNARQLLRLINQMLDLAKIESHSLPTNYIQADIILYLKYLIESFNSLAEAKKIDLSFHSQVSELMMDYDPDKLLKITSNLLSNAIKFTKEGGEVRIQCAVSSWQFSEDSEQPTDNCLLITVSDTGQGISTAQLPFIFDRFYQADAATTGKGEGTGIGLTLTRELVKLMEGEIQVESKEGIGSTFYVILPLKKEAARDVVNISEAVVEAQIVNVNLLDHRSERTEATTSTEKELLLIIEDNPDVVYYMQSCLAPYFKVETALNGAIGIEKALNLIPDLIISDVMMPEKDGFEVCHTLKQDERSSHIPIILLTAKAEIKDRITGLQQGADDYLAKPFDEQELFIRVRNLIELRKQLRKRFREASMLKPSEITANSVDQVFLEKALNIVEKFIEKESFGVAQLCKEIGMSQSQLHRKLKALLDQSPSQFIRSVRLQQAASLIKQDAGTLSEIAFRVGFSSQAYFSRMFLKQFGKSPSEYRKEV